MHTPPNAARRPARDGRAHLTLVTDQDEPVVPAVDDRQPVGRHAAPTVRVPLAGSATMRALLALGAVLSAIALSFGKADAVIGSDHLLEEAEPDIPEPEVVAPIAPADTTPAAPADAKPAVASGTTAGHWAPAIKPVTAHTYKLPEPIEPAPGPGRHRKSASADGRGDRERNRDDRSSGRHRHGHHRYENQSDGTVPARVGGSDNDGRNGDNDRDGWNGDNDWNGDGGRDIDQHCDSGATTRSF
jgi:hypothetical protein